MQKTTNRKPESAGQSARKGKLNTASQLIQGKVKELQQEIANLEAHQEVIGKEIKALNALIRYLERRGPTGKT